MIEALFLLVDIMMLPTLLCHKDIKDTDRDGSFGMKCFYGIRVASMQGKSLGAIPAIPRTCPLTWSVAV